MSVRSHLLLYFVKWPEPRKVKTRLAEAIGPEEACRVHKALAERCFEEAMLVPDTRVVVCGTGNYIDEFAFWLEGAHDYWEQPDGDLGVRLSSMFRKALNGGAHRVAAMGSDAPTLIAYDIYQALLRLHHCDISLLPAEDGGYVLIAMRENHTAIFQGIPWSTENTLSATIDACKRLGLSTFRGGEYRDVDREEDWELIKASLPGLV